MTHKIHRTFKRNLSGRDFVIGDIHGNKKRFLRALQSVDFDEENDRLFSLGDLVDRGKDCLTILTWLHEKPWFYAIRGNHEQLLINRFEYPMYVNNSYTTAQKTRFDAITLHEDRCNGGMWFSRLKSMEAKLRIYENLAKLPNAITLETEYGNVGLIHAEVPERFDSWGEFLVDLERDDNTKKDSMWNCLAIESVWNVERGQFWERKFIDKPRFVDGVVATFHGHIGVTEPVICGNQIWIDTGHLTGDLTIIEVKHAFEMVKTQELKKVMSDKASTAKTSFS